MLRQLEAGSQFETNTGPIVPVLECARRKSAASSILVGGAMALGLLTGTGAVPASATPAHVRYYGDWTSSGRTAAAGLAAVPPSAAQPSRVASAPLRTDREALQWLHEASGLTWDQLGKLFGVSRRSVHHWVNEARMNAHNAETLHELVGLVERTGGDSPSRRRTALLATDESGMSVLDRYRRSRSLARVEISGTPYAPAQLVDARHDPVETG